MEKKGYLLLEGGAEFGGRMAEPDLRAIELAGGFDAPITILPTAAAPDQNDRRAGANGVRWFQSLGSRQVVSLPLIDRASAAQSEIIRALETAQLVYLLGGFPGYLNQTLAGTPGWQAILQAFRAGAVVGGSSAGAMVLCEHFLDPETGRVTQGLNLIPGACVIPHHNTFGRTWTGSLKEQIPQDVWIGIDEQTGMIDDASARGWRVYGKGLITVYRGGSSTAYSAGQTFHL